MTLVERDSELRTLDQVLAESRRGAGQVVLVSGPVAAGKTELITAFARKAAADGVCVAQAYGEPRASDIPLGVVRQLAGDALSDIEPLLAKMPADTADDPYHLVRSICAHLLERARGCGSPVLVTVDDVQFADEESLHGIMYFLRHIRAAPVMLLLSQTDSPHTAVAGLHAELLRHSHCHRLSLSPLSPAGVARMVSGRLGADLAERLAPEWHAYSGGNPLLVRALTEQYPRAGAPAPDPAAAVGQTFTDTVLACLQRSGRQALEVARGVAVLGHDAGSDLLGRLLGLHGPELGRVLHVLTTAGLLDGLRFRHPAARAAVLRAPDFTTRADLHYRAAELLETEGAPPARVAEHLVSADRAGPAWSIAVLLEAAGEALRRGDTRFALRCLELAHRECPPGEDRVQIVESLIRAEWQNSPAHANIYLAELMDLARRRALPDRTALTLVKAQLWYGRVDDAVEVLTGLGDPDGEGETGAEVAALWHWVGATYPELAASPDRVPAGGEAPAPGPQPAGRAAGDGFQCDTGDFVRRTEGVLADHRIGEWWPAPAVQAILDLVYADQLKRADRWCVRLLQQAEAREARVWRGLASALRGEIARRTGQILQAEENSRAALEHLSSRSWGVMVGIPLANLIAAATARGEYEEADIYLERAAPEAMFATRYGLHYLEAQGQYNLATGRHQAALAAFLGCGRRMRAWGLDLPVIVPWRTGAAEALVRLGDRAGARRHLDEQLERPTGYHPRIRGAALRVRAATAEPRRRLSLLREATSLQRNWQNEFELLRALADLSSAYLALGEQHHARTAARRAWRLAERCQAEPLARKLLPAYGSAYSAGHPADEQPDGGSDSVLSAAELRVAELASLGHTNRQIAGKLYITVSTVEQHLTRVYRKLNVSRRVDLPARLGTRQNSA